MRFVYIALRLDAKRHCYIEREVVVWKITRDPEPKLIGSMTARNLDPIQMVATILRREKAVPAKFRAGGSASFHTKDLKDAGIHIHSLYEEGTCRN